MPVHKRRDNDGKIIIGWEPEKNTSKTSMQLPMGGGERSRPERIEANIAKVVHAHANDEPVDIAAYIYSQYLINQRLSPANIIKNAKLPRRKAARVAELISELIEADTEED